MGIVEWAKTPEGAFIIGMPVGYLLIDLGRKKLTDYLERTGESIGERIAQGMKKNPGNNEVYGQILKNQEEIYELLKNQEGRIAAIEKKVYRVRK